MTVIRQIYVNELEGVRINANDPMPYPIPCIFGVGKNPMVTVEKVMPSGRNTVMPLIYASFDRNAEGYVTRIWINADADNGVAVDNYLVYITPQQYLNV